MSESERSNAGQTPEIAEQSLRYEAPRIVWREDYVPQTNAISCARQPGNPGCNPGPQIS
jgi:hypothetical protein